MRHKYPIRKLVRVVKYWSDTEVSDYSITKESGVSYDNVVRIDYHEPQCSGDAHYVEIIRRSGARERLFNPDRLFFEEYGEDEE